MPRRPTAATPSTQLIRQSPAFRMPFRATRDACQIATGTMTARQSSAAWQKLSPTLNRRFLSTNENADKWSEGETATFEDGLAGRSFKLVRPPGRILDRCSRYYGANATGRSS